MSTPKTYKFNTLQEFFDAVPANRMRDCMAELTELFVNSKEFLEAAALMIRISGGKIPESLAKLPTPLEWIDDNRGEVTAHFTATDGGPTLATLTNQKQ